MLPASQSTRVTFVNSVNMGWSKAPVTGSIDWQRCVAPYHCGVVAVPRVTPEQAVEIAANALKTPKENLDYAFTKADFYRSPDARPLVEGIQRDIGDAVQLGIIKESIQIAPRTLGARPGWRWAMSTSSTGSSDISRRRRR